MIARPVESVLEATLMDLQREQPDVRTVIETLRTTSVSDSGSSGQHNVSMPLYGVAMVAGVGGVAQAGERIFGSWWPALSEIFLAIGVVFWIGFILAVVGAITYFRWEKPLTQAWRRFLFDRRTPDPSSANSAAP